MNTLQIPAGSLILLSGPPGSGKSTFAKESGLASEMIISSDELRKQIIGNFPAVVNGKASMSPTSVIDSTVFQIMERMTEARLKQGLTTVIDAQLLSDKDRNRFALIAEKLGKPVRVLLFEVPLDTVLRQNDLRESRIVETDVRTAHARLTTPDELPYNIVKDDLQVHLTFPEIDSDNIDIIGDVHGLYTDLKAMLSEMGYAFNANDIPVHVDGRKLLFLGDFVDRGPEAIETLRFVANAVKHGHYSVLGNHEKALVNNWKRREEEGLVQPRSFANTEMFMKFLRLPREEQVALIAFIDNLPNFYLHENYAIMHADVDYFHPALTPSGHIVHGQSGWGDYDTDAAYDRFRHEGLNRYNLIRGHIPLTSKQESVVSLDMSQTDRGYLAALPLDKFKKRSAVLGSSMGAFEECVVRKKTDFSYRDYRKPRFDLMRELKGLEKNKLIHRTQTNDGLLLYKYTRSVFYDALWNRHPLLLKARGIVFDLAGNIVQHPFDKIFNYGEGGAGKNVSDDKSVVAIEKINGFMGCITKDPYKKNGLLVTTTGSFDSDFVGYINDFIDPRTRGMLMRHFSANDVTLMFEVVHPSDPHIIHYSESEQGLYLIGARGKEYNAPLLSEVELDAIAEEIGVKRPGWCELSFGEVRNDVPSNRTEGYIVRDADPVTGYKPLLKFKTPFYLVTKFIGRMSPDNIKFMFRSPHFFKQKVDEEFYGVIDRLTENLSEEAFSEMGEHERVRIVRELIDLERDEVASDVGQYKSDKQGAVRSFKKTARQDDSGHSP